MNRSQLKAISILFVFGVSDAHATLISATLPPPDDAAYPALHRPTGCAAQVVMSYDAFVKAQITDPKCLPKGVKARDVPGTLIDFVVTPK